jgi:hypothetical protein
MSTYSEENLITLTHQYSGLFPHTSIGDGHTYILKHDWHAGFLKNMDIESERFPFLNRECVTVDLNGRLLSSTKMLSVYSNKQQEISCLQACNHAETDTRILLHLAHAASQGHQIVLVRTVDSNEVILAIHWFVSLGLSELWVCLGRGKKIQDIPIYVLSAQPSPPDAQLCLYSTFDRL